MNNLKKIKVTIFGSSYTLISDENQERLQHAAAMVDDMVKDIAKNVPSNDVKSLITLVSINLATKLLEHQEEISKITECHQKLVSLMEHQS